MQALATRASFLNTDVRFEKARTDLKGRSCPAYVIVNFDIEFTEASEAGDLDQRVMLSALLPEPFVELPLRDVVTEARQQLPDLLRRWADALDRQPPDQG